jgi:hypothetical protein
VTIVGAGVLLAAPKPRSIPAGATFGAEPGDGAYTTPTVGVAGTITSYGFFEAYVTPSATSPVLQLSLDQLVVYSDEYDRECEVQGTLAGCNPDGPLLGPLSLGAFNFRVKPLVAAGSDFDDLPGGLTGMACNPTPASPTIALVNYGFSYAGTGGTWGLNANPRYHADAATVVRTSSTTWEVTATGRAELLSWGHTGIRRQSGPSHEGQYLLPFHITIVATTAPAGPNC